MGIGFVNNPLLTYPDSRATAEAFKKFDLLVYSELFPTATTNISDIVLPAAMMHEHDTVGYWPAWHGGIRANVKLVDPPGEAWSDMKFINDTGNPILILTWVDEKNRELNFIFYGIHDGRTVELVNHPTGIRLYKKWEQIVTWPNRSLSRIIHTWYPK